eukprot:GHVS01058656.1.p2 GENE.GHVS01058656.1~~GHVS01058656.1.p2  ORF type:complete len:127 (+),score=3.55 GHVS01058656.1:391-771(+)
MGIITRSLWCLVMVMVIATVTEGLPCCLDCADLNCYLNCDPICEDPVKCDKAGENVYTAVCSQLCPSHRGWGGHSGGRKVYVPDRTCRAICSSSGIALCTQGQCLDKGCTQPKMMECINSVTSKCG